ncbi:NAD(P)-binding domain-containing protein [Burkholderia sp. Ac-20345]|uniref:flavin-containing monooxygenase n=1 Tax=Burkholderia sp. Ac-20345 TaxID=2703891 RepID=UPI00197C94C8|nr:NAD(P)-binding domain-containing protein [Burkholderia sp. Ac-20345]MBN3779009.1 NAD(P)-binding domain-containing protein [Burkholderia sp. Ac-20345]
MRRVAVIGAGPAGLVSAKSALEYGLDPVILERSGSLGGVWNDEGGRRWRSMHANISRFSSPLIFSDFPWPDSAPLFPHWTDISAYLRAYATSFDLLKRLRLNCTVSHVRRAGEKWEVTTREADGASSSEIFDFVIVATGPQAVPAIPDFSGLDCFSGGVLHSSQYRDRDAFLGKRVVVVGMSFSGTEIASDLAGHAKSVTQVIRRPYWIVPKDVRTEDGASVPWDWLMQNRAMSMALGGAKGGRSGKDANYAANLFFNSVSAVQDIGSPLHIDEARYADPPYMALSIHYDQLVKEGAIVVRRSEIESFGKDAVYLCDGARIEADAVILGTGYQIGLPFLAAEMLTALDFREGDGFSPILLYKRTFHPQLRNMALIGQLQLSTFALSELQARWASLVFAGQMDLPPAEVMLQSIEQERCLREAAVRPQALYGDLVAAADAIAAEIGVMPPLDALRASDADLYQKLWNGPLLPFQYRLVGPGANPVWARMRILEAFEQMALIRAQSRS